LGGHRNCSGIFRHALKRKSDLPRGKMAQQGSVLVVDDEVGPRESLRMILQPLYEVKTVSNGQEALRFLQERKIDLITLDLKMPGLSGLEVLREIKKMNVEAAVIIITAYGSLTNAHEAIRYGRSILSPNLTMLRISFRLFAARWRRSSSIGRRKVPLITSNVRR